MDSLVAIVANLANLAALVAVFAVSCGGTLLLIWAGALWGPLARVGALAWGLGQ